MTFLLIKEFHVYVEQKNNSPTTHAFSHFEVGLSI